MAKKTTNKKDGNAIRSFQKRDGSVCRSAQYKAEQLYSVPNYQVKMYQIAKRNEVVG